MATINLFGASGHAKVIMDIIEAQGDKVGVLYDDAPHCADIHGHQVLKATDTTVNGPLIISIGSNKERKLLSEKYLMRYAKAVHPAANISKSVEIGDGTAVMAGATINADARIGRHCIVNTNASIDHECKIEDYVHISPNAALCGNVRVGKGTWIGAGSTVIPGIKIGRWCTIGAGSVVIRDIPDGSTAYGNPCKIKSPNMKHIDNQQLMGRGGVIIGPSSTWLHNTINYAA